MCVIIATLLVSAVKSSHNAVRKELKCFAKSSKG